VTEPRLPAQESTKKSGSSGATSVRTLAVIHMRALAGEVAIGVARPPHGCIYVLRRLLAGIPMLVASGLPDFLVLSYNG